MSWAESIPSNAKPQIRAPGQANTTKTSKSSASHALSVVPSLTNDLSHSTGTSILTNTISITNTQVPPIQVKPDPDPILILNRGLSAHEDIKDLEHNIAMASPFKGKMHLNSEAHLFFSMW